MGSQIFRAKNDLKVGTPLQLTLLLMLMIMIESTSETIVHPLRGFSKFATAIAA